jgi:hypothetical protein
MPKSLSEILYGLVGNIKAEENAWDFGVQSFSFGEE